MKIGIRFSNKKWSSWNSLSDYGTHDGFLTSLKSLPGPFKTFSAISVNTIGAPWFLSIMTFAQFVLGMVISTLDWSKPQRIHFNPPFNPRAAALGLKQGWKSKESKHNNSVQERGNRSNLLRMISLDCCYPIQALFSVFVSAKDLSQKSTLDSTLSRKRRVVDRVATALRGEEWLQNGRKSGLKWRSLAST